MPRKKTARKQGEKFVSKVSDKMVEARLEELHEDEEPWQAMLATNQLMRMKLLAYIRAAMELEEISHEIAVIRGKQGVKVALVSVGPRGGKTFSPLHRLRKTKMNQVLQKYRSISKDAEWIVQSRIGEEARRRWEMEGLGAMWGEPPKSIGGRRKPKKAKKKPLRGDIDRPSSPPRHPAGPPRDRKKESTPISKQDISRSIKKLQRRLRRKDLLKRLTPAMVLLLKIILLSLQGWENDWEELLGISNPPQYVLEVIDHIAKLIEQANSFDKWFR